jgi:hypothetical protein
VSSDLRRKRRIPNALLTEQWHTLNTYSQRMGHPRELRERVDLVCRDLVYAYRRLAQKVADSELAITPVHKPVECPIS